MNLFSELYNCYYQVAAEILRKAAQHPLTRHQMEQLADTYGYEESSLAIIPKLLDGDWALLRCPDGIHYQSKLRHLPEMPLTGLQKSWLKALLKDERILLFFTDGQLKILEDMLKNTEPLFYPSDFIYFDRYHDRDPFQSVMYRQHFQTLLQSIRQHRLLRIAYYSGKNRTLEHTWLPRHLEYSPKDGKFRLYALSLRPSGRLRLDVLNVARILKIEEGRTMPAQSAAVTTPLEQFLDASLSREPLILEITNQRNALERTMLHFASYQKSVERLEDSEKYRCTIYYDKRWETELLIQVLSFGPLVKVLAPESFRCQIQKRILRQMRHVPGRTAEKKEH